MFFLGKNLKISDLQYVRRQRNTKCIRTHIVDYSLYNKLARWRPF